MTEDKNLTTQETHDHDHDHDHDEMIGVAEEIVCHSYSGEEWAEISVHAPIELDITVYVNQQEFVTVMCTPSKLNFLILVF